MSAMPERIWTQHGAYHEYGKPGLEEWINFQWSPHRHDPLSGTEYIRADLAAEARARGYREGLERAATLAEDYADMADEHSDCIRAHGARLAADRIRSEAAPTLEDEG